MSYHYLDNFVTIFKAKETRQKNMLAKKKVYIQLTDVLGISQNESKDVQGIVVILFVIQIDTSFFIVRLLKEKY